MQLQTKLNWLDGSLITSLVLLIVLHFAIYADVSAYPGEDAAMLMRYSQHLAQGHGIVWNIGEKPVDGATDFLFMVLLAMLNKVGMTVENAARLVGFVSHILTVMLVYLAISRLYGSSRWFALISAVYLAVGPALLYTQACFGTSFFALFACITWYIAIKLRGATNAHTTSLMFAFSCLIMGLIRPEGVFLAIFMLLSILYTKGLKESRRPVIYFLVVFAVFGGFYFFWRWHYFGYPLPNPYYKKGGGQIYLKHLIKSIWYVFSASFPFIMVFVYATIISMVAFASRFRTVKWSTEILIKITQQTIFSLIPIAGFLSLWVLLSDEMNYRNRFQYPILPIVLISWPPLLESLCKLWKFPRLNDWDMPLRVASALCIVTTIVLIPFYQYMQYYRDTPYTDSRSSVAVMLNAYKHKNYTMAITEAGLLPFYSQWKAIDTWGLNDQWIAHNGQITESYLQKYMPELIMIHVYFSLSAPPPKTKDDKTWDGQWFSVIMTLKNYAEKHRYVLAAVFGTSPYNTHYYYVRPNFPESEEIIRRIQSTEYFRGNEKCINYAKLKLSNGE
jgi:arabinofuranosyltransferase